MKEKTKKNLLPKISPVFRRDLERGMPQNDDVKRLQQLLGIESDGYYGPVTEKAVRSFQLKYEVIKKTNESGNGRVGPRTRAKLREVFGFSIPIARTSVPQVKDLLESPPPQSKCLEIFGNPFARGWESKNMVRCDLSMFQPELKHVLYIHGQKPVKAFAHGAWFGFRCHKLVVPKFQTAFKNVIDRKLTKQVKTFDGCFNLRRIGGSKTLSTHSWGIAIDLNAKWNGRGNKSFEMKEELAQCFEDVGFTWGGRWTGKYTDAMHFQYATVR